MRKIATSILFFTFTVVSFTFASASSIKKVEKMFEYHSLVDVIQIEYTSQSTTVYFKTRKNIGSKILVGHGIYIVGDDGIRRSSIDSHGIKLDSLYILQKGQRMTFSISFTPAVKPDKFLDVCMPGSFSIYGLHDKSIPIDIPSINKSTEEVDSSLFSSRDVIIEGVLHPSNGIVETTIYANYIPLFGEFSGAEQYAAVEENGRFKMSFKMQSPQIFDFRQSRFYGKSYKQPMLACPGDHIYADIYSKDSGIEVVYTKKYNNINAGKLANVPGLLSSYSEYVDNAVEGFRTFGYERQMADLAAGYEKEQSFAKYICWHYGLSPLESTMYLDRVHLYMILQMLTTDRLARQAHAEYPDGENMNDNIPDTGFNYLKNLPTDSYSFVWHPFFVAVCSELCSLPVISQCVNMSSDNMSGKMTEAFYKQKQVLASLTGTDDWSLYLDQILIDDIKRLLAKNGNTANEEIIQLSSLLHHPYSKQCYLNLNR